MAHKAQSFKLNEKDKIITIYTNVEQPESEKVLLEFYLNKGYAPKLEEKKAKVTVEQMRADLAEDEATLKAFDEAYATKSKDKKNKKDVGFFKACKIYSDWKKKQPKEEKK